MEEAASCATHALGLVLSVAGMVALVVLASMRGDARRVVTLSIYGLSLVAVYTSSMLYHLVRSQRRKQVLRVIDHAAIFLLIAGTYTPFTLVVLRGALGWSMWGVEWGLAAVGIALKLLLFERFEFLSLVVYVAMGWLALVAPGPLLARVPHGGIWLLLAGGLAYTAGVVFFLWDRLPFNHAIWHVFVLAGSILHFAAVVAYVLPMDRA